MAGKAGGFAAQLGIGYDVLTEDFSSALYDTADYFAYSALAGLGAAGAIETLGGSAVAAGSLSALYYNAGGAKGIVQSAICGP
ncbi:MAG: hypothetical protein ACREVV_11360 [Steroidobacteraceae bacterium]